MAASKSVVGTAAASLLIGAAALTQVSAPAPQTAPQDQIALAHSITVLWCPDGLTTEAACPTPIPSPSPSPSPTSATPTASPAPTPTATLSPTPTPTASPSPSPSPTSSPIPTPTPTAPPSACTQTFTGDATGTTDVTSALASFLSSAPAKQTVCLKPNGVYKIGLLPVYQKAGLWLNGQGATLNHPSRTNSPIFDLGHQSTDLHLYGFTIKGANPNPGKWSSAYEHEHCLNLGGAVRAEVDHVTCLNVGGDGVYFSAGRAMNSAPGTCAGTTLYPAVLGDGVKLHDNVFDGIGRMGIAWTDGSNHTEVWNNIFRNIGYYTWDIEPNGYRLRADGCLSQNDGGNPVGAAFGSIHDNSIGPKPYGDYPADTSQACGYNFVTTVSSAGGRPVVMDSFDIRNNTNVSGQKFLIQLSGNPTNMTYGGNTPNQGTQNPAC